MQGSPVPPERCRIPGSRRSGSTDLLAFRTCVTLFLDGVAAVVHWLILLRPAGCLPQRLPSLSSVTVGGGKEPPCFRVGRRVVLLLVLYSKWNSWAHTLRLLGVRKGRGSDDSLSPRVVRLRVKCWALLLAITFNRFRIIPRRSHLVF